MKYATWAGIMKEIMEERHPGGDPADSMIRQLDYVRSLINQHRVAMQMTAGAVKEAQLNALMASVKTIGFVGPDQDPPPPHVGPYARMIDGELLLAAMMVLEAQALSHDDSFRKTLIESAVAKFTRAASDPMPSRPDQARTF